MLRDSLPVPVTVEASCEVTEPGLWAVKVLHRKSA